MNIFFAFSKYITIQKTNKCMFTRFGVFINHDKEVYPCQYYKYSYGSLNNSKLSDAWNSKNAKKFRKQIKTKLLESCKRCTKF